jgi:hypothetical protein
MLNGGCRNIFALIVWLGHGGYLGACGYKWMFERYLWELESMVSLLQNFLHDEQQFTEE